MSTPPPPLRELGETPPERTPEQRWVLACQGILTELFEMNHARMGGVPRPLASNIATLFLGRDWGVVSSRGARETIQWLLAEGHRVSMAESSDHTAASLLAWDLVRAAAVAGWSYAGYHLEAEEAWAFLVVAARKLRLGFDSWAEVGASYRLGRGLWGEQEEEIDPLLERLLAPGGAWDITWGIELPEVIPPPVEELPVVVVDSTGDGDYATINDALRALKKEKRVARVVVRGGTYNERVEIAFPCELDADGVVTIACDEGAALVMERQCARVRGFALHGGKDQDGTYHAVYQANFLLKLVDCSLSGERCGVYSGIANSLLVLERCRIHDTTNSGVLIENGAHASIVDCTFTDTEGTAVFSLSEGELYMERVRVERPQAIGVAIGKNAHLSAHEVDVVGAGHNGIEIHASAAAKLTRAKVVDGKSSGIFVVGEGDQPVQLVDCTATGNAGNDLGVQAMGDDGAEAQTTAAVSAERCVFGGGAGCAVTAGPGGRAHLTDCTVRPAAYASVCVMGDGFAQFEGGTVAGDADMAVWIMPGGALVLQGVSVQGGTKPAMLADAATSLELTDINVTGPVGGVYFKNCAAGSLNACELDGGTASAIALEASQIHMVGGVLRGERAARVDEASTLRVVAVDLVGAIDGDLDLADGPPHEA